MNLETQVERTTILKVDKWRGQPSSKWISGEGNRPQKWIITDTKEKSGDSYNELATTDLVAQGKLSKLSVRVSVYGEESTYTQQRSQ